VNETDAMIELSQEINRTILRFEGGVRSCPAFIGCYNEDRCTVCYANAGHTLALLRDATRLTHPEATGLPLGLFSHTTRDAYTVSIHPRGILLIASRGIVEAPSAKGEFGLQGLRTPLQQANPTSARDLCLTILQAVEDFMQEPPMHNALLRNIVETGSELGCESNTGRQLRSIDSHRAR
jgi:serine phosphatase RsbU (regulator of sigma subunit)